MAWRSGADRRVPADAFIYAAEHHSTDTSAGSVLLVLDNSERCGHFLAQQTPLYHSIKPLIANEPLLVVYDNVDVDIHMCRASQRWRI